MNDQPLLLMKTNASKDNGFDIILILSILKELTSRLFSEFIEGPSLAAIFIGSSQSDAWVQVTEFNHFYPLRVEQQVYVDTERSPAQTSRQEMCPPPHNAFLEMQEMISLVEDHPPVRSSVEQQGVEMFPQLDNRLLKIQDIASSVGGIPPEQSAGPFSEQCVVRPPESTVVSSAPGHEGSLKHISKYLVQCVPVKPKKPSSSNFVTGASRLPKESKKLLTRKKKLL